MTRKTFSDDELLRQRLAGVLPVIDIAGQDFVVNWELKRLELEKDRSVIIDLDGLPLSGSAKTYWFYYNTVIKQMVKIAKDITHLPTDTVMVIIPYELKLDPVGVALDFGRDPREIIKTFPIEPELKAKVIPIEQTGLAVLVQKSKEQKKQKNWLLKPFGKRKGKGL